MTCLSAGPHPKAPPHIPPGEARPSQNNIQHASLLGRSLRRTSCGPWLCVSPSAAEKRPPTKAGWVHAPSFPTGDGLTAEYCVDSLARLTPLPSCYVSPRGYRVRMPRRTHARNGRDTFARRCRTSHQIPSRSRKQLYTVIGPRLCSDAPLSRSSGSQFCSVSVLQPNVIRENMVPRLHSCLTITPPPPHPTLMEAAAAFRADLVCLFAYASRDPAASINRALDCREKKTTFKKLPPLLLNLWQ